MSDTLPIAEATSGADGLVADAASEEAGAIQEQNEVSV